MASNTILNPGTAGDAIVTKQVTHDGDTAKLQMVGLATITGTEDSYTMVSVPSGNGTATGAVRVSIASDTTGVVAVTDNGGSLTVDGTVTVSQATAANLNVTEASAAAIAASASVLDDWDESDRAKVNLIAGQAGVAGGAGAVGATVQRVTLASDDPAVVSLGLLDNAIAGSEMQVDVVGALPAGSALIGAVRLSDGTDIADILDLANSNPLTVAIVDAAGDQITSFGGGTQYAEDSVAAAGEQVTMAGVVRSDTAASLVGADGDRTELIVDSTGRLHVNVSNTLTVASHAVTNAGTFAVQASLNAGTNNIGDVDVLTVPADPFGANADAASATGSISAKLRFIAGTGIPITGTVTVGSHAVTNAGTFATQVDGAALTSLQLIDNLVLAEDAAHSSGDPGLMPFAVRRDANTSLVGTDGDYAPFQVDANGALKVNITAGAGSGGTASTDDAAFTVGSGSGTPAMGIVTADSVDSGDVGVLGMLANRQLKVTLFDSSGSELSVGGGTQYDEDTAHVSGDKMTMAGVVRQDTAAALSGTDGDRTVLITDSTGKLHVNVGNTVTVASHAVTNAGTFATQAAQSGTWTVGLSAGTNNIGDVDVLTLPNVTLAAGTNTNEVVGDVAHDAVAAGNPLLMGAYASAAAPSAVSADGDAVRLWATLTGALNIADGGSTISIDDGGGSITVDGTVAVSSITTSVIPGTSATHLGKAVDAVAGSTDTGVNVLAIRDDALTTLTPADGDYTSLRTNSTGALWVEVTNGVTGVAEDAASAGGETGIMVLAVRRDSASSGVGADGDFAALSVTSDGSLRVSGGGGGTQFAVDTAAGGTDTGTLSLVVRDDALATLTPADNDYTQMRTNARGALWVALDSTAAQTVTLAAGTATNEVVGDAAHDAAAAGNPLLIGAYASAAAPTDVSADADVTRLWALRSGAIANQPTFAGVLALAGNGASGTGVMRVTLANDSTGVLASIGSITTAVTPGTGAGNLGKAEDAAHTSGDTGVFALAVRSDTLAATSGTTGDYEAIHTDSVGAVWTRASAEIADDAAFTPGTSRVIPVGFQADESSTDSVDEGDAGCPRMTLDRKQIVTIQPHTQGGLSPFKSLDIDETEEDVKTSAGQLYFCHAINMVASTRYLKFYNATAANVTVGTTVPVLTFPVPPNSTTGGGFVFSVAQGFEFATAISVAATTAAADNDAGAPGTGDVIINIGYK